MVTIEQKLSLFSKLLQQDISNEINEKISELEKEYEIKIKEHKTAVDVRAAEILERAQKRAESKKIEYLSRAHMQTKREYMQAKEKQVTRFMKTLEKQIELYVTTDEYKLYLEKLVGQCQEVVSEGDLVIYMTPGDLSRYREYVVKWFKQLGVTEEAITFKEKDSAMLGGLVIENQIKTMRIDLSIASRIREQKEEIIKRIFEALGEVGE
ncbi:MAG: V-type ATP synthase subunit E [Cellulosilyticaceae bacterium]